MIVIKDLTYSYHKSQQLFRGLNMTLTPGKVYGLLGRNGAGKSSLIKNMAGLVFPHSGSCLINGIEARLRDTIMLEQLFFIPEECELPPVTIPVFISIYGKFYPYFNQEQFYLYLQIFSISPSSHLRQLSFGQKKKVYIAFALATNTDVLIMDEPTNGLDIPSKVQFREIVAAANRVDKITIMSTHQVKDLDELVDSVIIIEQGEILMHAHKEEIAEKLFFSPIEHATDKIIYTSGKKALSKNESHQVSNLDLEMLFNAAIYHPNEIKNIFRL
ncbi:ATP-binding cassette domain-containing protein [Emticicia sp. TH156]|uniref:ABC transporter ATP-binding protein n=1 Tax=Emticicia sp. TH156 TaxID=2067454 RepID=UPI00130421C6|nr:ABC transporter ATP-binding protein [Emticicia sp. TH156]